MLETLYIPDVRGPYRLQKAGDDTLVFEPADGDGLPTVTLDIPALQSTYEGLYGGCDFRGALQYTLLHAWAPLPLGGSTERIAEQLRCNDNYGSNRTVDDTDY